MGLDAELIGGYVPQDDTDPRVLDGRIITRYEVTLGEWRNNYAVQNAVLLITGPMEHNVDLGLEEIGQIARVLRDDGAAEDAAAFKEAYAWAAMGIGYSVRYWAA